MEGRRWLKESDIEITHYKGSGPGGQNRNKRMTGVRIVHRPTGLVAEATERRSQAQNLEAALDRLEKKIARLYFRPKPRKATKKTRGSQERRLETKRQHSRTKSMRRSGFDD